MTKPRKFEMIDWDMVHILQQKTEAERLAIAHGMWRHARDTIRNILRSEHPEWDDETLTREVARWMSRRENDD